MEEIKKVLDEIFQELKWLSKQNEKIMELLGKVRQPCGQKNMAQFMKIFDSVSMEAIKRNPTLATTIEQLKETLSMGDRD